MLLRFIALTILTLTCASRGGAEPLRLTLSQALQLAERNNPELMASTQAIAVASANVTIAGQRPNPTLGLAVPIGPAERKQSVFLNIPLETGGRRDARLALAESGVREATFSQARVRLAVLNQARNAFVELGLAEAAIKQTQGDLEFFDRLVQAARRRFEAGDVAEAEVIRVLFEREQSKRLLYSGENRVAAARLALNLLLGQTPETQVEAVDDGWLFPTDLATWPLPDLPTLREMARRQRPDVGLASQQLETAQRRIELAVAEQSPVVSLQGSMLWNPVVPSFTYLAGVQLELPWGSDREGEVEQARARQQEALLRQQAALATADAAVVLAFANFQNARQQLSHNLETLGPQADRVLKLAEKIYEIGQGDITEVLVVGQSVQRQRQLLLADYAQLHQALGALELAVNANLVGGKR